ncbi:MAG: hypothetical protein ABUS79_04790 [Pseudomonadota bacterium]
MRRTRWGLLALAVGLGWPTAPRAGRLEDPEESPEREERADTSASAGAAGRQAPPTTFEGFARGATPVGDLGTLLSPFSGKCDTEKRDIDRMRCQTARAHLRRVIPGRSYFTVVDDPATLTVSDFDGSIKGYHVSVAGCVSCTRPITVGDAKDQRFITVKVPEKGAASLRAAVELSRNSVGFDSLDDAKSWLEQGRPELRTQFVFRPAETEWTFGTSRGYALTLLAVRVFNRCTGEVLISRPPSTSVADMSGMEEGCARRRGGGAGGGGAGAPEGPASDLPAELSKNSIEQAMNAIRPQVFACFQRFKVPGLAQYEFEIAGNGTVQGVRLSGAFFGTPTGVCLLEAGQNARFPPFARDRQRFVYPFFLRQ